MGAGSERFVCALTIFLIGPCAQGQFGNTFAYTGDDALRDQANTHIVNYGGFANNLALQEQTVVLPYLPTLFYECGYLLRPANRTANVVFAVAPEIFLTTFFMGRVSATAELVLLNEAGNKPERGIGLRLGGGYSALGSTFGFTESGPIVRAGILIGNIRLTYMYSLGKRTVVDHQVGIGIKFDW